MTQLNHKKHFWGVKNIMIYYFWRRKLVSQLGQCPAKQLTKVKNSKNKGKWGFRNGCNFRVIFVNNCKFKDTKNIQKRNSFLILCITGI